MSESLAQIRVRVAASRERLATWLRRLAAVSERLSAAAKAEAEPGRPRTGIPLFGGSGATSGPIADAELHFELLGAEDDTQDPGREKR